MWIAKLAASPNYRAIVEWDPSGRIVATAVMQPLEGAFFKYQMDNGFFVDLPREAVPRRQT